MSNVDAPDVGSGETNIPDLLAEQSGMPNMSSTRTFVVDTNMQVNGDLDVTGTVTATSFIGDGSQLTGISGGTGGGLDSAAVTLLVDSDYVQARETPQDFAYSSLTGAPTALSSFTNDTSYITAADIPTTVDSDYVALRAPAGGGLDSAGVQLLIDADLIGSGINSVAIGDQATANFEDAIAIGRSSISSQADTIAMGTTAVASGSRSVAIGNGTDATAASAVALGNSAQALATNAIAIGLSADTNLNADGIAIGSNTEVSGAQGISIGQNAASSQASVAIGSNSSVTTGTETTAIGPFAGGTGSASLALGRGAKANANNTIVLAATGGNSTVATQFGIDIRTSAAGSLTYDTTNDWTFGATVNAPAFVGDGSGLTNLPAGGGLDSAGVQLLIDAEVQDPTTLTLGASSNAGIGIGSGVVTNGLSGGSVSIGTNANSYINSIAIGSSADASGTGSVSVGPNTQASGNFNTAIGRQATTSGSNSLALGYSSSAGNLGIALGDAASGQRSIAIGALASATNNGALHINANYNSGVGPTADGGLVIETSAARLEYSAASDWTFSAGVTMTDLTSSGVVIFSALPTTDPVNAGQLWNDAGTLKVSAG